MGKASRVSGCRMHIFSDTSSVALPLTSVMTIVIATLVTVWLLGFVTEHRKDAWRKFFHRLLSWLSHLISERMPLLDRLITTAR